MVIETLVGTVLAVLLPYVAKGGEEFAKEAGKESFQKVKAMVGALKEKLATDKQASDALASYERDPVKYEPALNDALTQHLSQDPKYALELSEVVKSLNLEGGSLKNIVRIGKVVHSTKAVHGDNTEISIRAGRGVHFKK